VREYLSLALALLVLSGSARAGTVTLTGSCPDRVLNGTAFFNLSNSGNDTPYGLTVVPHIPNAQTANGTYSLSELPPGPAARFNMTLSNVTGRGTYVGYFDVAYQQGGSDFFTAVFPCKFSFRKATVSSLYLSPTVLDLSNGTVLVRVALLNGGASEVDSDVSLILPSSLSNASYGDQALSLAPGVQENVSFYVRIPSSDASYSAAVAAGYEAGGLSYASLSSFTISSGGARQVNFGTVALAAAVAATGALLVLLALVSMRKKRKPA